MRSLLIALFVLIPGLTFAHGGGLDSNGGHYNRKTGQYHCHREPCFSNQKKAQEKAKPAKATEPKKAPRQDGDQGGADGDR